MKFNEAEKYIAELTGTQPWLIDSTQHLHQIFSIPTTLRGVAENKKAIVDFAGSLGSGPVRLLGKGDKASNAKVIAAYARLFAKDVEYTDFVTPGCANVDAFVACTYSGQTGDLIYRMKLLKEKTDAKLFGITNRFSPDNAPAGTIYDLCDAVLHQPLPEDERTIVSSMSSFGIAFSGMAAMDVWSHNDNRVFNIIEVLAERVKAQLSSQGFWNECLEMARLIIKQPSYWFATDLYLGAVEKISINLLEQSGLHAGSGLIDDFSHREIGLVDSNGATLVLVDTPDIMDKKNFARSADTIRQLSRKSDKLELREIKLRGSFLENVSDLYLKIICTGYMASMLREIDPNAARSFMDKIRSY